MSDDQQPYLPSMRFKDVNTLLGNHFRFVLEDLPDLTFFAQSMALPGISSGVAPRDNPFVKIPEVGDHLAFETFSVNYLIDNAFKTYFSLFYWLKGYGFPTSYQDIVNFEGSRRQRLITPHPLLRDIQKTHAVLTLLQPDNDTAVAELHFEDVFPVSIGQVAFETTGSEPELLKTTATFAYTDFSVRLTT
jgi:hypothetical protein